MDVEISPEPTPEEREAILAALAAGNGKHDDPWWRAGLLESLGEDDDQ